MNNIYDTIQLPNGGTIMLDQKAYETLGGQSAYYNPRTKQWKKTIDFESCNKPCAVETAAVDIMNSRNIEMR